MGVDVGGMMGGMDAAGAMGAAGGLDLITILKYVLITLGGGALLGLFGGKFYASIRYPNPEKRQLFNAWQKIAVLVVTIASIALIVGAFWPRENTQDAMAQDPMASDAAGGADMAGGAAAGGDATASGESSEAATDTESGTEASESSGEESEAASSESTAPAGGSAGAGATGGGGGGGAVMIGGVGSVIRMG